MDLELKGKKAIVTGGSRGIGKAVARGLAMEGVDVAIVARGLEALQVTAEQLAGESGRLIVPISADTGDDASVKAMVLRAVESLGHVDILVNCAAIPGGTAPAPKLDGLTGDLLWEDVNVKVMGYLRCAREAAPNMVERGWGRIVNVSGLAARQSGSIIGSIRNVAVSAMTKNLADDLGPLGINVTVVHPGATRTERTPGAIAEQVATQHISTEEAERQMAGNSIGKIIDAREVAHVVTFLASPKSVAVNGDAVAVGGGVGRAIHY